MLILPDKLPALSLQCACSATYAVDQLESSIDAQLTSAPAPTTSHQQQHCYLPHFTTNEAASNQQLPSANLFICTTCQVLRCNCCTATTVDTIYCPYCHHIYLSHESLDGRCQRCVQCPMCVDQVLTVKPNEHDNTLLTYRCTHCNYSPTTGDNAPITASSPTELLTLLHTHQQIAANDLKHEYQNLQNQCRLTHMALAQSIASSQHLTKGDKLLYQSHAEQFTPLHRLTHSLSLVNSSNGGGTLENIQRIEDSLEQKRKEHYVLADRPPQLLNDFPQTPANDTTRTSALHQRNNAYPTTSLHHILPHHPLLHTRLTQRCTQCKSLLLKPRAEDVVQLKHEIDMRSNTSVPQLQFQVLDAGTIQLTLVNPSDEPVTITISNHIAELRRPDKADGVQEEKTGEADDRRRLSKSQQERLRSTPTTNCELATDVASFELDGHDPYSSNKSQSHMKVLELPTTSSKAIGLQTPAVNVLHLSMHLTWSSSKQVTVPVLLEYSAQAAAS